MTINKIFITYHFKIVYRQNLCLSLIYYSEEKKLELSIWASSTIKNHNQIWKYVLRTYLLEKTTKDLYATFSPTTVFFFKLAHKKNV